MKDYYRILSYARPFRGFLPKYVLLNILYNLFGVVNVALMIPMVQVLFKPDVSVDQIPEALPEFEFTKGYFSDLFYYYFGQVLEESSIFYTLVFIIAIVIICTVISNIFRYFSQRTMVGIKAKVVSGLRAAIFEKSLALDMYFFVKKKKGDIMSRITTDVQEVESSVAESFSMLIREPIKIIVYLALLFTISANLSWFLLIYTPITVLILSKIVQSLKKKARYAQSALGAIIGHTDEALSGIKIIKGFAAEKSLMKSFSGANQNYSRTYRNMSNKREMASPVSEVLMVSMISGIILYGGYLILSPEGGLVAEEFFPYIFALVQIMTPAKAIGSAATNIQRGLASSQRIFEILDYPVTIQERPDARELKDFRESIRFKDVSFAYDEKVVLKNISLDIAKGKTIALVGPSGGGKTTLSDLVPRFYDPQEGEVLIDDVPVKDYQLKSLRSKMGIVTQECILFNDTILKNIAFGDENPDREQIIEAAKVANAHEFIAATERGYDTEIGDRGMRLSGGQRQRLAIARAVYRNPPILILDEATSALDTESEKLVQEALTNLRKNRTSLIIAHRLSTIIDADEIIVVQDGEIKERGTHQELVAKNGVYTRLHGSVEA